MHGVNKNLELDGTDYSHRKYFYQGLKFPSLVEDFKTYLEEAGLEVKIYEPPIGGKCFIGSWWCDNDDAVCIVVSGWGKEPVRRF